MTDHPRWAALLPDSLVNARLVWAEGYADRVDDLTVPAPLALRLDFPTGTDTRRGPGNPPGPA